MICLTRSTTHTALSPVEMILTRMAFTLILMVVIKALKPVALSSEYPNLTYLGYAHEIILVVLRPANVISTSYGYNEADLTPAYTARQCNEYAKLGLLGTTFIYRLVVFAFTVVFLCWSVCSSSGDNGVAGNGALCLNADGSQTTSGAIFNPR